MPTMAELAAAIVARQELPPEQGDMGPTGPEGKAGLDGSNGRNGDPGPKGATGDRGPIGATGADGRNGTDGKDGVDGDPGLVWRGPWVRNLQYWPDDAVEQDGSSYVCTLATRSKPPSGAWDLLAKRGATGPPGMSRGGGGGGGGGSALIVKDEGVTLDTAAASIDFAGAGVIATNVGHVVTVTIPGGGGLPAGGTQGQIPVKQSAVDGDTGWEEGGVSWLIAHYRGLWDSGTAYVRGDAVRLDDSGSSFLYVAAVSTTGTDPLTSGAWDLITTPVVLYGSPNPAIAHGLQEVQNVAIDTTGAPADGGTYDLTVDSLTVTIIWSDDEAAVQAAYDLALGAGVVGITGDWEAHAVSWVVVGAHDAIVEAAMALTGGGTYVIDVTEVQDGISPGVPHVRGSIYARTDGQGFAASGSAPSSWSAIFTSSGGNISGSVHAYGGLGVEPSDAVSVSDLAVYSFGQARTVFQASADIDASPDDDYIRVFDASPGLTRATRPTLDPTLATPEAIANVLIALGLIVAS